MYYSLFLDISLFICILFSIIKICCSKLGFFSLDLYYYLLVSYFWSMSAETSRVSHERLNMILENFPTVFSFVLIFSSFIFIRVFMRRRRSWGSFTYLEDLNPLMWIRINLEFAWSLDFMRRN